MFGTHRRPLVQKLAVESPSQNGAPLRHAALEVADPDPRMLSGEVWRQMARFATIGIFLIMFG
jgi:hypothetical protein